MFQMWKVMCIRCGRTRVSVVEGLVSDVEAHEFQIWKDMFPLWKHTCFRCGRTCVSDVEAHEFTKVDNSDRQSVPRAWGHQLSACPL